MLGLFFYLLLWIPLNLLRLIWSDWKIEGRKNLPPRPQGMILAVNHLHWSDILVVGASLPLSHRPWWVAKVELFNRPIVAWWFRTMHVIPIRRGQRDLAALEAAEEALKQGAVLIMFPEGHRSDTRQLQQGAAEQCVWRSALAARLCQLQSGARNLASKAFCGAAQYGCGLANRITRRLKGIRFPSIG